MTGFFPDWFELLLQGVFTFAMLASTTVILTRAGKSPYYALFWMVPFVQIILIWIFAFQKWPNVPTDKKSSF